MEHLEGETLGERLLKGALPLDQALTLAIQIADALDAAHRAGIVHRDLKPGNVMLTKAGAGSTSSPQAKLLDFGLAKATGVKSAASGASAGAVHGQTALPTTPAALTLHGVILGTVRYMAPEQIEGQDADARTDIFAFGCVVYEMVTGAKAFTGKAQASLMSAIMQSEPPPMAQAMSLALSPSKGEPEAGGSTGSPRADPPDHLVRRCLATDPDARWQTIHDVKEELRWIANAPPAQATPAIVKPGRDRRAWAAAGAFALALAAAAPVVVSHVRETPAPLERAQFAVGPPEHADFSAAGSTWPTSSRGSATRVRQPMPSRRPFASRTAASASAGRRRRSRGRAAPRRRRPCSTAWRRSIPPPTRSLTPV